MRCFGCAGAMPIVQSLLTGADEGKDDELLVNIRRKQLASSPLDEAKQKVESRTNDFLKRYQASFFHYSSHVAAQEAAQAKA